MALTDKYVKGLKAKDLPYRIFEKGTDKGFGIQISSSGSASFFIQYAIGGKKRFYNLGRYPSVSLSDARDRCREARLMIDNGDDPQNKAVSKHGTVANLFDYYTLKMKDEGKRSWEIVKRTLDYNCQCIINMPANAIEPTHIRKILHDIIARGSPVQANRVRLYLKRAFELGIYHDNDPKTLAKDMVFKITTNPVDAVPKDSDAEIAGERNLTFDEIKILWFDNSINERFNLAVKLLLIFGCRPWELCGALKAEFDFKDMLWTIPPERIKTSVKNKRPHLLPITPLARQLIDQLWLYSRESPYLFPGRYDDALLVNTTSLQHATDRIACIEPFTPRDLRRTWKTRTGEVGIEKSIRDRIQNHSMTDVSSKHYDRYGYLTEKRTALEQWENHLIKFLQLSDTVAN